jgi:ubiquinone/menaquinone biosynthesis C-methylase UbiE
VGSIVALELDMSVKDATQRFSSRVENYVRYRPGYPLEIIDLLKKECGLTRDTVIADIAFGTGLFTRLLLENGNRVIGVEPNDDMRRAGEEFLKSYQRFTSVAGAAEATTLLDPSVDIITVAQAAHWFDCEQTRTEFQRILKPGGWLVLVWNERHLDATSFAREYEELVIKYGTDYLEVRHQGAKRATEELFASSGFKAREFQSRQEFDYAGLEGRLLSSSYALQSGDSNYSPMLAALRRIFEAHQVDGHVGFEYDTRVYFGRLD